LRADCHPPLHPPSDIIADLFSSPGFEHGNTRPEPIRSWPDIHLKDLHFTTPLLSYPPLFSNADTADHILDSIDAVLRYAWPT
jgi:hypothetical protein